MKALAELYKNAPIVLWVEDVETRAWLNEVWQLKTPNIAVWVAGGRAHVDAMCKQAVAAEIRHVFGLVDRDFGTSNQGRWDDMTPEERVYRLDVHEIENLLLEPNALSGCARNTGRRSPEDIDRRLFDAAKKREWWVSCAHVVTSLQKKATAGYPAPPRPSKVTSKTEAESYICTSTWFSTTAAHCSGLAEPIHIRTLLDETNERVRGWLEDGTWRTSFPGKELFREVSGYVQQNTKGAAGHVDLAKAVGAWQREYGQVPLSVTKLRRTILNRLGFS